MPRQAIPFATQQPRAVAAEAGRHPRATMLIGATLVALHILSGALAVWYF